MPSVTFLESKYDEQYMNESLDFPPWQTRGCRTRPGTLQAEELGAPHKWYARSEAWTKGAP